MITHDYAGGEVAALRAVCNARIEQQLPYNGNRANVTETTRDVTNRDRENQPR